MKYETLEESKEVLQRLILMPSIDLFSEHSLSKVGGISNGNLPNIDFLYLKTICSINAKRKIKRFPCSVSRKT
jgi:hypothetical protein